MKQKSYLILSFLLLLFMRANAQQDSTTINLFDLSIEELMEVKVSILTKKDYSIRETPSTITVISSDDLKNSGVTDLREAFELFVPGFQFGVDVEGAVGIGVRGIWANEGKVLFMIDGIELNEEMYATLLFGGHYGIENIQKIEISRGPGSAVYGGYAGMSVINVITKKDKAMVSGGAIYAQMKNSYASRGIFTSMKSKKENFEADFNLRLRQSVRSEEDNIDFNQNSMPMLNNSDIKSGFANLLLKYKKLEFTALADLYDYSHIDLWGENHTSGALQQHNGNYAARLGYEIQLTQKQTLSPEITLKYQQPWNLDVPEESYINSKYVLKYTGAINHKWEISNKTTWVSGVEFYKNTLNQSANIKDYEETFINNANTLSITNLSFYTQGISMTKYANFAIGGRFDVSSEYGNSFVPRLAITKVWPKFHFKTSVSQSFRIPGGILPNRIPEGAPSVSPEKATSVDAEFGFTLGTRLAFTSNLFFTNFNDVIVYQSSSDGTGFYTNSGKIGTKGMEMNIVYKNKSVNILANYAFYITNKNIDVSAYLVPGQDDYLLAMSPHRLNTSINTKISKNLVFNVLGSYFSKRYGYAYYDVLTDTNVLQDYNQAVYLHANIRILNLMQKHLELQIGVRNLLDTKELYIQAYNGNHAPLPGLGRSVTGKLIMNF